MFDFDSRTNSKSLGESAKGPGGTGGAYDRVSRFKVTLCCTSSAGDDCLRFQVTKRKARVTSTSRECTTTYTYSVIDANR